MENKKSQTKDYRVISTSSITTDNDTKIKLDNDKNYTYDNEKVQKSSERTKINYQMMIRLPKIHALIKSKKYPNKNKIIKYLVEIGLPKYSVMTITRDLEFLKYTLNAPLEYDFTHKGYFYTGNFEPDFENHLSQKELNTLFQAKILLSHYKNTPIYTEASEIIDLLTSSSTNGKNLNLMKRITVAPTAENLISIDENLWNLIQDSLTKNQVLQFDYTDIWGQKTENRRLCPYQLVLEDDICYLFGFDKMRNAERIFSLSRMKNVKLLEETFVLPEDFEFEKHTGNSKFGAFFSGKKEHYVIEFYDEERKSVCERKWAENQKITENEYETCIEFDSTQALKIKAWVLSAGCNARPFEPQWLADEWKRNAQEMCKMADAK